jgi:thioredoxin-related protein
MKKLLITIFSFTLISFIFGSEKNQTWFSFGEGINKASKTNKPALIFIKTDWCKLCKEMEITVFSDEKIQKYMNENFVAIMLNAENKNPIAIINGKKYSSFEIARKYKISSFPTILFMQSNGRMLHKLVGYQGIEGFKDILHNFVDKKASNQNLKDIF